MKIFQGRKNHEWTKFCLMGQERWILKVSIGFSDLMVKGNLITTDCLAWATYWFPETLFQNKNIYSRPSKLMGITFLEYPWIVAKLQISDMIRKMPTVIV